MTVRVARRQNARRSRGRGHAVPLLLFLLALTTCCALLWAAAGRTSLAGREFAVLEGLDPRAKAWSGSPFARFRAENDAGLLSYQINCRIELEDAASPAGLSLGSPIQNGMLMRAEILLDEDGKTVFSSGLLLPGSKIEAAPLDFPLEAGEYSATAWFYAVDPVDRTERGRVGEPLTIAVLS